MSLFKWSTPERRAGDRILPLVPNEIHLHILEYVAPGTGRPLPEELDTLTRLSLVCRFFANICLPRIFEHVEFSGALFRDDTPVSSGNDTTYRASRESTLCEQIANKQPLALSLAQCVKVCRFTNWKLDDSVGSWAVRIFVSKYLSGMTCMKNIRRLEFSRSFVDKEHWWTIANMQSLEEVYFDRCPFLPGPADVKPEKRKKIKVSHLEVINCTGTRQLAAVIDTRFLQSVTTDVQILGRMDWTPESSGSFKELHVPMKHQETVFADVEYFDRLLFHILNHVPRSLEVLNFPFAVTGELPSEVFAEWLWSRWAALRSVTVRLYFQSLDNAPTAPIEVISFILDGVRPCTSLESLTITSNLMPINISVTELRDILSSSKHRRLDEASSRLEYVDICGVVLRLVDGEWTGVSKSSK